MKLVYTDSFKKDFQGLPIAIRRSAEKTLRFFITNLRYPSLRIKKMKGRRDPEGRDIWEARATKNYRFTFSIAGEICALRRIGAHDVLRNP
jgi:hypothetical protein